MTECSQPLTTKTKQNKQKRIFRQNGNFPSLQRATSYSSVRVAFVFLPKGSTPVCHFIKAWEVAFWQDDKIYSIKGLFRFSIVRILTFRNKIKVPHGEFKIYCFCNKIKNLNIILFLQIFVFYFQCLVNFFSTPIYWNSRVTNTLLDWLVLGEHDINCFKVLFLLALRGLET